MLAVADDVVFAWRPSSWNDAFATGSALAWAQAAAGATGLRAHGPLNGQSPGPQTSDLLPGSRAYCYPNPVDGATGRATVRFYLTRDALVTLQVYDAIGSEMDRFDATDLRSGAENEISWNVDKYASGLYLCRLSAHGGDGSKGDVTLRMAVSR